MKKFLIQYLEQSGKSDDGKLHQLGPVVTISRECGCSAKRIATKLSKILTGYNYLSETKTEVEWKWVSKEMIELAAIELEANPDKFRNMFPDEAKKRLHELTTAFSTKKMFEPDDRQVIDTAINVVRSIAETGHFIIVGLAGSLLLQDIPKRLSVKLQAPLDWRINRIMQISNLSWADAQQYVQETDRHREFFVEQVAGRKTDNNDFDLIFNYSTLLDDQIVDVIVNVLKNRKIISSEEED